MAYKAGHFYFPTSGGSFGVDLPFEPQGVALFGGNQSTEDALLTGGNPGLFFGMIWRTIGTEAVDYQSQSNTAFGVHWQNKPITCASSGTGVDYEASSATLDSDGFTINVTTPASGSRLVHYLAWGEFDGAHGASMVEGTSTFTGMGYRPFTALMFNMFAAGSVRNGRNGSSNYYTMGVSNWPEEEDLNDAINNNIMAITFRTFTSMGSIGYTQQFANFFDTSIAIGVHSHIAGTYLSDIEHFEPWPTHLSDGVRVRLFGSPNRSSTAWWSGEGSSHFVSTPDEAAQTTVTARQNLDAAEAALFFGVEYGEEQFLSPHCAYHFGVLTEDYQGCVAFDTAIGGSPATGTPSFFQSKQYCLADNIRSTGMRVASGELSGRDVILTGIDSSNSSIGPGCVQIYGPAVDEPSMYVMDV